MALRRPAKKTAVRKSVAKKSTSARKKASAKPVARKVAARKAPKKKTSSKRAAVRKPPSRANKKPKVLRVLPRGERWFVLDIPFEFYPWARSQGAEWAAAEKVTVWGGATLPLALEPYRVAPWSWGWHQEATLNAAVPPRPEPAGPVWEPRAHQLVAIDAITKAYQADLPGFVLADDVGVGKTMSAWGFVQRQEAFQRILIVTTLNVLPHWRYTLQQAGHDDREVMIINYDQLTKVLTWTGEPLVWKKGRRKRIAQRGAVPEYDLIIFDEAHKGRRPEAARSILMRRLAAKATFNLWLSATIGTKPLELSYLAVLLSKVTGETLQVDTLKEFGQWCEAHGLGVKKGSFGAWIKLDPDNPDEAKEAKLALERVNRMLFHADGKRPAIALRRVPQDVAGWPEMERQLRPEHLDFEERQSAEQAWAEFASVERSSPPPKKRGKADKENALVRLLRLRQAFSMARLPSTLDLIEEMVENGKQVAVSVAFLPMLDHLATGLTSRKLSVVRIQGGQSRTEREQARLAFQRDQAQVVLFTPEEGISLHQGEYPEGKTPRVMLLHDIRPSAIQMAQIEGRCHRDGKLAPIFWLFAEGTAEMVIAQSVLHAVHNMKTMMGDDTQLVEGLAEQLYAWAQANSS